MSLMTNAMEKMTKMLLSTDSKLKEYGAEPYGQRKLTSKEQRDRVKNLTQQELLTMIDQYGAESTNEWLNKYWEES